VRQDGVPPAQAPASWTAWSAPARAAALAVAYVALAWPARWIADTPDGLVAFWPSAGLALAALLASARADWPWLAAGVLAGGAAFNVADGHAAATTAGLIAADVAVPLIGALAIRRVVPGTPRPWRLDELWALLAGGVLAGPALGALVGAVGPALAGDATYPRAWLTLATSSATGILLVAPPLLAIPAAWRPPASQRTREAAWLLLAAPAAAGIAFGLTDLPFGWFAVLPLLWAGLRLGSFWVAVAGTLCGVVVLALTARGHGSYAAAAASPQDAVLLGQAFLCVAVVVAATLAAIGAEHRATIEQLRHAQRIESVGRMATAVAHDFNHLLAIVGGYGTVALERAAHGEDPSADIRQMVDAGERGTALTRQLLTFSGPGGGERRQVVIDDLVVDMAGLLRSVSPGLELELDAGAAAVEADPSRLEQVLLNLVLNARDATADGGTVAVRTRAAGAQVALAVTDTGAGMDAETRARAIEPFFTTKDGHGSGLGLSTVYGIVQEAGGRLEIDSEPGHGTRITVRLPRAAGTPPGGDEAAPARGAETVLLVEDDAALRALLRTVLAQRGFTVLEAADGAEALALADGRRVDLVVTDITLPGMEGPELLRRLRERRPDARAVFISGYDAETVRGDLDGTPLMTKPFSPLDLVRRVRAVLDA
jgi:signal transduction histidine kinase